jgi:hypothetical protein
MTPFVLASLFVVSGVIVETLCAGKGPSSVMKTLHQPRWAFPMPVWYALGFFYYMMCIAVVYRTTASGRTEAVALMLTAAFNGCECRMEFHFFPATFIAVEFLVLYAVCRARGRADKRFVVC